MARYVYIVLLVISIAILIPSCQRDEISPYDEIPLEVVEKLENLGFNPEGIIRFEDGYLIERDIWITKEFLNSEIVQHRVPFAEQYSTNNLVSSGGNRTITIYISAASSAGNSSSGGNRGGNAKGGVPGPPGGDDGGGDGGGGGSDFSATYGNALDEALARYNAENLELEFLRVSDEGQADIVISRLKKGEERQGILGSAGFPTSAGDPHDQIKMSGILESTYGLDMDGIATILAHEIGHCIGFRHTDYFDRSISCGGGPYNEGDAGIGANHIPGTPTGASYSDQSWMLSCTDGSDRPFNNDDQTALDYLY